MMKRSLADMEADKQQLERDQAERAARLKKIDQELEGERALHAHPEMCTLFEQVLSSLSRNMDELDPQIVSIFFLLQ